MNLARHYFPNRGPVSVGDVEFRRRVDGAVEVWRKATPEERLLSYDGPQFRRAAIIPANTWASIVTTLTTEGETGFTFGVFLAFHNGGNAYDPDADQHDADPEHAWR